MKKSCTRTLKFRLVFTALLFLSISNVYAQRAQYPPFMKYAVNNYSTLAKAACDTCTPVVGAPLERFRPIPFPEAAVIKLATGIDVSDVPGLMSPNFWGGGSPEIKGYVKPIAGMLDVTAENIRNRELLYFKGARGVAISKESKTIYTSAPTVTLDPRRSANGFFTFKSTPALMPLFNTVADDTKTFNESPTTVKKLFHDEDLQELPNACTKTMYFAIDPNHEEITYASMVNPLDTAERALLRKKANGDWYIIDWTIGGVLTGAVWGALAVDNDGNLYIADPNKNIIVKATFDNDGNASSWEIIAGTVGIAGYKNDEDGLKAMFNRPSGICFDNNTGNIYVGDAGNNRVRKIANDGEVTTYAGNGQEGFIDNDDPTVAKFDGPTAVAYNEMTESLFVIDYNNKTIREIDKNQHVSTLAGHAGSFNPLNPAEFAMRFYFLLAKLNMDPDESILQNPTGLAIDPEGHGLYVSDYNYIRYVSTFPAQFVITSAFRESDQTQLPLPVLPLGLRMNENNGAIFGIPLMAWPATTYTVSVLNSRGSSIGLANGFFTIEVAACPKVPDTAYENITIFTNQLPYHWNGLTLNAAGRSTVTLQSSVGCDSTVVLTLNTKPDFNYNSEPYLLSQGKEITPIVPTTAGSQVDLFSISPPLSAGLTLNTQTGVITGTPTTPTTQLLPAIGPRTPTQCPAPWTLEADMGADITQVKISDGNQKTIFENNSAFRSLQGSAGQGTGTAGAYTDFSGLGPIKMFTNSPYSMRLSNALAPASGLPFSLNTNMGTLNFMNSYAVYIDYNRDGDFADAGERAYISAAPQTDAHAEIFNLNIPVTAKAGVTKMRIYCVEAKTALSSYVFYNDNGVPFSVFRTTSQALSFYPFFSDIQALLPESQFHSFLDYGEFEDYNIDIVNMATQSYVVTGSNALGTDQSTLTLAINIPSASTTNTTICSTELPYHWNGLTFLKSDTLTAHLINQYGADSAATLNLFVKQASSSVVSVTNCGPYTYRGQLYTNSGDYVVHTTNAAGCDSVITFRFRQKATASLTNIEIIPTQLPYTWNGLTFTTAGTRSATLTNAEGCDSIATLVLRVQYDIYYTAINTLEINKAIQPISPQIEGNYSPVWDNPNNGYNISPALPNGLQLNASTGVISGTPTQLSPYKTYTVTLLQDGAKPSTFILSVGQPTSSTTTIDNCGPFSWNDVVYTTPGTKSATFKNQYGFDSTATLLLSIRNLSVTIIPLFLNQSEIPYAWNGISITKEGAETIHLVNAVGCDSAVTANVTISPKISYQSPNILAPNVAIAPIIPLQTGGSVINYTIQPSLVNGLVFDEATGIISGTPADTLLQPVTHTIHAFNNAGADNIDIIIAVCNPMATSFTLNTCDQYAWNDSTYTTSTTHTRTLKNKGGCDSVVTMHLTIRYSSTGPTTTATACGSYVWYGVTYDTTGVYTKVYPNAVGCDSTIYLNLIIKNLSYHNRYVNLNLSDLPYTWRGKTFTEPGTQSIVLQNTVGCDSVLSMTVNISDVLPDISYAIRDTILYWEKTIETPIGMINTGTAIPVAKLGERDTLIAFTNGPGDQIKTIKGPDGAYYARVFNSNNIFKLNSSGVWTVFVHFNGPVKGMVMDKSGNLFVCIDETRSVVRKITPDGVVSTLPGFATFSGIEALALDPDDNLIIHSQMSQNQIRITRFNLSTNQYVQTQMDNPYFDFGPEDMKTDSRGNIYMYRNVGSNLVKIKPNGHMSGIGQNGSPYDEFKAGNGIDAKIPLIASMAIDTTNDNVYLMAFGYLLRVDTAENVTAITGRWFDQYKDQIFRVDNGKLSIVNSSTGKLYTVNVYGVGSLPFMDNYGVIGVNQGTVNFKDLDKRIRLDSSGAIVGTARANYSSVGTIYANNTSTAYSIIAANHYGTSTAPMVITTKAITYKLESFLTTSFPFIWRGRSLTAATDTATYLVTNKTQNDDTLYMLHLVYEGVPEAIITKGDCVEGQITLAANTAAKNAISFDGTNFGLIKNVKPGAGGLAYYNVIPYIRQDGSNGFNFVSSFEVWIKPTTVTGTQYIVTRDTAKTNGTFFGLSIQDGKLVYEFTKGRTTPFTDYKLTSGNNISPNVWTHVAASYYDSTLHIYINGQLQGTLQTPENSFNVFYSEAGTGVGIFPDFCLGGLGHKFGFKGEMDEFRAWGAKRDAAAIQTTMNSIVDPFSTSLGLYYRFDGDVSESASDISRSNRKATFIKPATSVSLSTAPINFASYQWMPGGATTKFIVPNPASNTLYTLTVTDYKGTSGSASLLVYPNQGPAITPPTAVTRTNSPLSCTVFISDADLGSATATDNCPGLTVQRTGVPADNVFPLGVTTITYTAISAAGRTKTATQTVTIIDNNKPVFTSNLSANTVIVWPADHKLKNVALTYTTTDNCGTVTNNIIVTSTDPITGVSDGDKSPDWIVSNDHLVQLRAERGNGKEARVYTITVTPVDRSGNVGTPQSINVYVAHNITGPVTGTSFKIGSTVDFSGVFWDKQGNKHTGEWVIDDNTIVKGTVTEPSGTRNGKLTGSYKFTAAGTYKLKMNITDQNKLTSYCNTNEDMEAIVVIYDPNGGYTYGGGWFASSAGALKSDASATGKANFGYAVNYFKGAANPKGETQFELKVGDLEYNALNFEYLSIAGARAQIKGTGKITGGQSGINFIMTVIDGALDGTGIDKIRIKVYNKNTGQVYYDNEQGSDANNPVTKVGTNSQIVIGGTNINTSSSSAVITTANTSAAPTVDTATRQNNTMPTLQAKAFPNPSGGHFMLFFQGKNNEPVSIRVSDVLGRLVEVRQGLPADGTFTLGASYRSGVYIAEVMQGKEKVVLKLIKQ
jgi:hypothetical protein